jgi:hypothetical protein
LVVHGCGSGQGARRRGKRIRAVGAVLYLLASLRPQPLRVKLFAFHVKDGLAIDGLFLTEVELSVMEVSMNRLLRSFVAVVPVLLAVAGVLALPGIC